MRLIDADVLLRDIEHYHLSDGKFQHWVEVQPTIEPERKTGKWIPCSVSPPVFPCVVCDAHGNRPSVPSALVTLKSKEHGTWVMDGKWYEMYKNTKKYNCMLWENRIVAWMPLPEPYRKEGE